jgi:Protein of unknown function (DUF2637)
MAARLAAARRNVPAVVLGGAMLAVELIVAAESFRGLVGFGHQIGITGVAAFGVPVTLDGVAVIAALLALRAELAGESSGLYRLTLVAFTSSSAAANAWHAHRVGGIEAALYLGLMSLAVTWLFVLSLRQIRTEDRRKAGRVTDQLPRFSSALWARYPRVTFRAWSLAVLDGHTSPRDALAAARELPSLPDVPPDDELAGLPKSQAGLLALAHCDGNVILAQQFLAARGVTIDRSYLTDVRAGRAGRRRARRELGGAS